MSLYVGNIPPHVRGEDLERNFRRFGRCTLQLKDGYGFVIYEVNANAEKALRALRGKIVCGEHLSLNWSNRQPRSIQRPARNSRFYEPYPGRNLREGDNGFRFRGSQDQRDFGGDSRVPIHNRGTNDLDDVFDKETGHISEDANDTGKGKGASVKESMIGEGGASELNPVENDRWVAPASDALTGHGQEDDSDFDRYEPYHGYNRRDEKEYNQRASPYGSRERGSSLERGREHSFDETERNIDKGKPQQICYNCGQVGHIMRYCPRVNTRRDKFSKYDYRRDEVNFRDKGEGRAMRLGPNSWGRPNSSRDPLISRRHPWDRKESHSEKTRRVGRSEAFPKRSKNIRSNSRSESQGSKKRKPENGTPKKAFKKRKARRSGTSSSSDSSTTNSQSHCQSSRSSSAASTRSRSKSISSRSRSRSSSSRSTSASSYSKSRSSRSRSKSRSRSSSRSSLLRSQSLSVSLDQKSQPIPLNVATNVPRNIYRKGNLEHVPTLESKHRLANLDTPDPIGTCSKFKGRNVFPRFKADGETNGEHLGSDSDDSFKVGGMGNNADIITHTKIDINSENQRDIDVTSQNQGDKTELQENADVKLKTQIMPRCEASSTRISTKEMLSALKHYGLATPDGGESSISVEAYFGAARMWPWEMIYYRRLKKGPISTENYARRLEQNREFGIVDKYIRSSSGWGECHQNDSSVII